MKSSIKEEEENGKKKRPEKKDLLLTFSLKEPKLTNYFITFPVRFDCSACSRTYSIYVNSLTTL